jgi:hypothetical protein
MIEIKMSNGKYFTHEDLDIYLNQYEDYYDTKFVNGMLEYEWKDLILENNNIIENTISKIDKIELIIKNIKKEENYSPGFCGPLKVNTGNIGIYREDELSVKLRGNEDIGIWKKWNENNGYGYYEDVKIKELYIIEFEKILIKNQKKQPFKKGTDIKHTTPSVTFLKLISEKPTGLKKGDRILFNLNITDRVRFKGKEEYIILNYVEKVNLISPILVNNKSTNKNCFIVTTTMGDENHPVVIDFRKYRDEVLLNTYFGRELIRLYYTVGPLLSKVIKNNKFLFLISKKMILKLHKLIK